MAARLRIWQDRSAPALYALARLNGLAGSIPACLYSSSSPRSLTSVFWPDRAGSIRSRSPLAGGFGVFGLAATASSVTDAGSGDSSPVKEHFMISKFCVFVNNTGDNLTVC
jgi:hypothetical protein